MVTNKDQARKKLYDLKCHIYMCFALSWQAKLDNILIIIIILDLG